MVSKGSSLQSSFHLQMLAMSSQLASPGIGDSYRMIAKYFRWTMLGVRGSVPVLDGLFRCVCSRNVLGCHVWVRRMGNRNGLINYG